MNNFMIIFIAGVYTSIIGQVSLDLGLTTTVYSEPEGFTEVSDSGFLEGLISALQWATNNVSSILQLMTFNTAMPYAINAVIVLPVGLAFFYLAYVMIRGGAS